MQTAYSLRSMGAVLRDRGIGGPGCAYRISADIDLESTAIRAQARHHPRLGLGFWPIRPLSLAAGLRPAGPGDERADEPDRDAGRNAARHRLLDRRPLYLAARNDRQ